jgi:hypothetical protein
MSGCSHCDRSRKDIIDYFEGKKKISHKERIARLKKAGSPLVIKSKNVRK